MNKKNKICIILPGWVTKQTGGAEWQAYLISEELIRKGWKVSVITNSPESLSSLDPKYLNDKIDYFYFKSSRSRVISILKALYIIYKASSSHYYLRTDAIVFKTALKWHKIFCKNVKSYFALALDSDAMNYNYFDIYKKDSLLKRIDLQIASILNMNSIYSFNGIIAQSYFQVDVLFKQTGRKPSLIRNSLKLTESNSRKENIILFAANMRSDKNPEALVEVFKGLKVKDWKIVIAGRINGYESLLNYRNENVVFLGELPYRATLEWFMKSRILINTSNQEGFSNTFIQAWYYKVWIESLVVDPDIIINEKGYGKTHDGNVVNMIESIQQFIDGKQIVEQKLQEAHSFVISEFDLNMNINKLEALLNDR